MLGLVLAQAVLLRPRHSLRFLQQGSSSDNAELQETTTSDALPEPGATEGLSEAVIQEANSTTAAEVSTGAETEQSSFGFSDDEEVSQAFEPDQANSTDALLDQSSLNLTDVEIPETGALEPDQGSVNSTDTELDQSSLNSTDFDEASEPEQLLDQGSVNSTDAELDQGSSNSTDFAGIPEEEPDLGSVNSTDAELDQNAFNLTDLNAVSEPEQLEQDQGSANSTDAQLDQSSFSLTDVDEIPEPEQLEQDQGSVNSTDAELDQSSFNSTDFDEVPEANAIEQDQDSSNFTEILSPEILSEQSNLTETESDEAPTESPSSPSAELDTSDEVPNSTIDEEPATYITQTTPLEGQPETAGAEGEVSVQSSTPANSPGERTTLPASSTAPALSGSVQSEPNSETASFLAPPEPIASGNAQLIVPSEPAEREEEAELRPNQFRVTLIPQSQLFDPPANINLAAPS